MFHANTRQNLDLEVSLAHPWSQDIPYMFAQIFALMFAFVLMFALMFVFALMIALMFAFALMFALMFALSY